MSNHFDMRCTQRPADRLSVLGTTPPRRRGLARRRRGLRISRGPTPATVLGQQASHHDFAILFGSGVFAIAAEELFYYCPGSDPS